MAASSTSRGPKALASSRNSWERGRNFTKVPLGRSRTVEKMARPPSRRRTFSIIQRGRYTVPSGALNSMAPAYCSKAAGAAAAGAAALPPPLPPARRMLGGGAAAATGRGLLVIESKAARAAWGEGARALRAFGVRGEK